MIPLFNGCSSKPQSLTDNPSDGVILTDVGEACRSYQIANKRPPAKLADFNQVEMAAPLGVQAVKTGDIIVRYGATLPDLGEEPGKVSASEVLAYQKQVPEQGGYILQLDRTIKKMTADEFKVAPKAGK